MRIVVIIDWKPPVVDFVWTTESWYLSKMSRFFKVFWNPEDTGSGSVSEFKVKRLRRPFSVIVYSCIGGFLKNLD